MAKYSNTFTQMNNYKDYSSKKSVNIKMVQYKIYYQAY